MALQGVCIKVSGVGRAAIDNVLPLPDHSVLRSEASTKATVTVTAGSSLLRLHLLRIRNPPFLNPSLLESMQTPNGSYASTPLASHTTIAVTAHTLAPRCLLYCLPDALLPLTDGKRTVRVCNELLSVQDGSGRRLYELGQLLVAVDVAWGVVHVRNRLNIIGSDTQKVVRINEF